MQRKELRPEPEHVGSIWKHPYMIYVALTLALFVFLLVIGWAAMQLDMIPKR